MIGVEFLYKIKRICSQHIYSFHEKMLRLLFSSSRNNENSRVYMFHSIEPLAESESFISDPGGFRNFLVNEVSHHVPAVATDIINFQNSPCFAVTFDDGYESVFIYAYPILKELHIPFTLFITVNYLDRPGYLTKKQLQELSGDSLCTIGSHTLSHPLLRFSPDALKEIHLSKIQLEKIIQKPVVLFAYPFGSVYACSRKNIHQVKKSGYQLAFSTVEGSVNVFAARNRYFIPRINADHLTKQTPQGDSSNEPCNCSSYL